MPTATRSPTSTRAERGADTDGDGTPDYQDDDSDGDGIPDYREAGDGDRRPHADRLRSRRHARLPRYRQRRQRPQRHARRARRHRRRHVVELPGPRRRRRSDQRHRRARPERRCSRVDTDNDGTPDFHDTDSDDDTISDFLETRPGLRHGRRAATTSTSTATATASPIARSAPATRPPTPTCDHHYDFIDRDSDNDGVPDATKTRTATARPTPARSSATDGDTDSDGVSDLDRGRRRHRSDERAPSNPQANGDFVFVEPYMKPQSPVDDDLDFSTKLQAVDLYVLLDRSGSMSPEITTVKNNLATRGQQPDVPAARQRQPATASPICGPAPARSATRARASTRTSNYVDIQPNPNFAGVPITEPGGCCAEPLTFARVRRGHRQGGAAYGMAGVPARATCAGSPAANARLRARSAIRASARARCRS